MTLIEQLNSYAAMSEAEMRARSNALPEIKRLLSAAADALADRRNENTSPEVAALASKVLSGDHKPSVAEVRTMAGSLLTQAEDHTLIPNKKIITSDNLPPEAVRALEDAIRHKQALPIISRDRADNEGNEQ